MNNCILKMILKISFKWDINNATEKGQCKHGSHRTKYSQNK